MQQKRISNLERVASVSIGGGSRWVLQTSAKLEQVLRPNYFGETWPDHGLLKHDEIRVIASYAAPEAEYATVVVTRADGKPRRIEVVQL